tara:strand:+ start:6772 stop:7305 length:534 start_codon:yes stop_codon:yes gene_type:complete
VIENESLPKPVGDTTLLDLRFFAPQSITEEARAASVKFWLGESAMPHEIAAQRASQVICHGMFDNQLIGIASGYVNVSESLKQPYFQYRTFISNAHRHKGHASKMLLRSFEGLSDFFCRQENPAAIGVLLEIPPTLAPLNDHLVWPETQFHFAGVADGGSHLRVRYFEQVKMKGGKV